MGIRLPTQTVSDKTFGPNTTPGSDSVLGVTPQNFYLPTDIENCLVKVYQASVSGTGAISVLFQTTDDGGTTWYDVARSPLYGSANGATSILTGTAMWMSIPVSGEANRNLGLNSSVIGVGSVITTGVTGTTAASTLAAGQKSGLPLLGVLNRICLMYSGNITTNDGVKVRVLTNQQAATS